MDIDPMGLVPFPSLSSPYDQPVLIGTFPTSLDTREGLGPFVKVSTDKLTAWYTGSGGKDEVGAVRATWPAPGGRIAYYFEMVVKNSGQNGLVAIGFGPKNFNLRRQPGWESGSCGYHGDDGHLYTGRGFGKPFGPTFSTGDTIGAGINYASQEFFFTKNGKLVGNVRMDIKVPIYPLVGLHSPNEEVYVNFGLDPLLFNFEAFMLEERIKQRALIQKLSFPPNACHRIIRSYLLHYGYKDTLDAFDKESESFCSSTTVEDGINEQDIYALNQRKILREHIKNGEIDLVFDKLQEWYPQVVQNETSTINFLLHSQQVVEYLRVGNWIKAGDYAQTELSKFAKIECFANRLLHTFALLRYNEPLSSPVWHHHFLGTRNPEFVADAVNVIVLSTNPNLKDPKNCASSRLERLLRQLNACSLEYGDGVAFDLFPELGNGSKPYWPYWPF
ncbi:hypothetical protein J5N97_012520 [Dioscorea zingiberensis]|uniref:Uncharacterized protein n=1 Tax=Dioscorea zingiberensis TaxID=325984 RepID=A0A9D5CP38_9LILI|nr:hypothetical protein J5N97_012520 [Dioscorea zingiberensis]